VETCSEEDQYANDGVWSLEEANYLDFRIAFLSFTKKRTLDKRPSVLLGCLPAGYYVERFRDSPYRHKVKKQHRKYLSNYLEGLNEVVYLD